MKKLFLLLILFHSIATYGQNDGIKIIDYKFKSMVFKTERAIKIYLPEEYELEPKREFPVVYIFDAQDETLFNLSVSTIDFLIGWGEMQPVILVGIISENRQYEFLPPNNNAATRKRYKKAGGALQLMKSLKEEVFPYVKSNYRTNNTRLGIGHSLGATFLIQTLIDEPDLFDGMVLISPNLMYDNEQILNKADTIVENIAQGDKYVFVISGNTGSYEKEFNPATKKLDLICKSKGLDLYHWNYTKIEGYDHGTILLEGIHKGIIDYANKYDLYRINQNGYVQIAENNFEQAFAIFERGIELYPDDSNIYDSMGEAKEKSGDLKGAFYYYSMSLKKLVGEKNKYPKNEYNQREKNYKNNIKRVEE